MTMKPMHTRLSQTRAAIGNIDWRDDLTGRIARLVDRLSPDRDDPELFHIQKSALAHELRRLAHWSGHVR